MATMMVGFEVTGYRGRGRPWANPVPFSEAWTDVDVLAGLIFVVTLLVLEVRAIFTKR